MLTQEDILTLANSSVFRAILERLDAQALTISSVLRLLTEEMARRQELADRVEALEATLRRLRPAEGGTG